MWMSDKPRTQQQLARDLAGLVDVVPDATAIPFLDAFWKTMAREWSGIDVLRCVCLRCAHGLIWALGDCRCSVC